MKRVTLFLLIMGTTFAQTDTAQVPSDKPSLHSRPNQYSTYIGIAGGYTSGYGLSIRKWFQKTWALQLNLFPMYTTERTSPVDDGTLSDSGYKKNGNFSCGLLYLRKLTDFKFGRVVFYGGGNILVNYENDNYYSIEHHWYYPDTSYHEVERDTIVHTVCHSKSEKMTFGAGAGSEFYIWRFALHFMLGICAGYEVVSHDFSIMPSAEGGIQFRLK